MDKKAITIKIGNNIKEIMNEKEISTNALSRQSGISVGSISKITRGRMSITVPVLIAIANGLDTSIDSILSGLATKDKNIKPTRKVDRRNVLFIGIMSINNKRLTCIKDYNGVIVGTSELSGGLDLAETSPSVLQLINDSIKSALSNYPEEINLKSAHVAIVLQSYEFEETRIKFETYAKKFFKSVKLLPDWKITYLAAFEKKPGISLVIDKGVSLSYMQDARLKKLGGWKFPVYDLGGENWLGVETIKHTIEVYEGYEPRSNLAQAVLSKFEGKIEKITEYCFKSGKNADIYCDFAEILVHSYLTSDEKAKEILSSGFNLIYKGIKRVDQLLGKKLKITLNGSLANIYRKFFPEDRLLPSLNDNKKVEMLADIAKEEN